MQRVIIGVDPHKLSATIEVVDKHETVLASGRFSTDKAGYAAMRKRVAAWPERTWAVEGSNGAGRSLAQRLVADGEHVVDVPAKLSARARLLDTGHGRKTDAHDAHSVAVAAVRAKQRQRSWLLLSSARAVGSRRPDEDARRSIAARFTPIRWRKPNHSSGGDDVRCTAERLYGSPRIRATGVRRASVRTPSGTRGRTGRFQPTGPAPHRQHGPAPQGTADVMFVPNRTGPGEAGGVD